jgi:hypothetical protein
MGSTMLLNFKTQTLETLRNLLLVINKPHNATTKAPFYKPDTKCSTKEPPKKFQSSREKKKSQKKSQKIPKHTLKR